MDQGSCPKGNHQCLLLNSFFLIDFFASLINLSFNLFYKMNRIALLLFILKQSFVGGKLNNKSTAFVADGLGS